MIKPIEKVWVVVDIRKTPLLGTISSTKKLAKAKAERQLTVEWQTVEWQKLRLNGWTVKKVNINFTEV